MKGAGETGVGPIVAQGAAPGAACLDDPISGPRRPDVLAVDGGNSKVEALLVTADGELLGRGRAGGASFAPGAETMSVAALLEAVGAACSAARIVWRPALATLGAAPALARVAALCLAGDDLASDDRRILTALRPLGLGDDLLLHNDTFPVLRAGTERSWGICVVCGAGMNCAGIGLDGRTIRFASLGELSGDAGGGGWLGQQAVRAAVRAGDGRGPRTRLEQEVPAHFGLPGIEAVLEALHAGEYRGRLPELASLVFAAAEAGDGCARELVERQADEIVLMVASAVRRLELAAADVDVVLGGGLFRNESGGFVERVRDGVLAVAPRAHVEPLTASPVLGAALLGLDQLDAAVDAAARLRGALL